MIGRSSKTASESGFGAFTRSTPFLTHPVFNRHHTEHEMLRYIKQLEAKDLSLTTSMIPLGSCTMKLNATAEMLPVTWPEVNHLHPFAPTEQHRLSDSFPGPGNLVCRDHRSQHGFSATECRFTGRVCGPVGHSKYHRQRSQGQRDVCLIPLSAHGTNPASAVMAGFRVVPSPAKPGRHRRRGSSRKGAGAPRRSRCADGDVPSTHGVFEEAFARFARSFMRTAGRFTWMAPT